MKAKGSFDVDLKPQADAEFPAGRMTINKVYQGGMAGTGKGQMVSKRTEGGAAAYFAVEEFSGILDGRKGGFTLLHRGHMSGEGQTLHIQVLEGSGSGDLQDVSGSMTIEQSADGHNYELSYERGGGGN